MKSRSKEYQRIWKANYRANNREEYNAYMRGYNSRNKEKVAATNKAYRMANKDRCRALSAKKRAIRRNATMGCRRAIEKIYERAGWWRQWFDVVVDHVIPLARGGAHSASNLQIIYAFENSRKYDSLTYKPRVIFS